MHRTDLHGQVVTVTGSSSGIGRAIAVRFGSYGARVIVNSRTNREGGEDACKEIRNVGGEAVYVQADVSQPEDVSRLFEVGKKTFGPTNILINNAGRTIAMPFLDSSKEHWQMMLDTNLMGTVLCSIEAVKQMRMAGHGAIVNTASVRGLPHCGRPGILAYCAAKAAVISFTETLAKEMAPIITVNAIAPGFVNTPYLEGVAEETKAGWLSNIPLGRFIQPDEVVDGYIYLATAPAATGTVLIIDGGFNLRGA